MAHLALYRKWRPQTFGSLVGQEDIAAILKAAVANHRQTHAYLFCGTRGTGKTSTARILAKALNCTAAQRGEPCNECASCQAITEGRSLDVFEIDAASNRGIDEVRDLLEKVHFVPAQGRVKVYIIDETHMLTTEAFNALLKTFEEPPAHVVFILATTEPRKVPLTILSRCQRFDFKPIDEGSMVKALKVIAKDEGLQIDDDALIFLAQKARGSMRDALSLLDQGMGVSEKNLTLETLGRLLGSVMVDFWPDFIAALAGGEAISVFQALDELAGEGKDLRGFCSDFREVLGDILSYQGDMTQSYGKMIKNCRGLLATSQILAILTILGEGESAFRYQRENKVVCRFLFSKVMRQLQSEETAIKPLEQRETAPGKLDIPREKGVTLSVDQTAPAGGEKKVKLMPKPARKAEDENVAAKEETWSQILAATKKISPKTFTWLSRGQLKAVDGDTVTVVYYAGDAVYREKMGQPEHQDIVAEALVAVFGRAMKLSLKEQDPEAEASLFN